MLSDKNRIEKLEKHIEKLLEAKEKTERDDAIKAGIERFLKDQEKSSLRYAKDVFKAAVIVAAFYTGGGKLLETPFMQEWIK